MVAIKGRQEFCPFSPVCHKILWTSKEITSFEVSITIPELSNIQIFSSNMKAERNSSTGRNRNKNKNKGRFDGNKDVMQAKFCIGDNATLQSGIEYRVNVKANLMPNTSQPNISTKAANSSLMFRISANSTKYLLVMKKHPRDFRISSESKLKIKARIMSCGVEGNNITSWKNPKNKTNSQRRKNTAGKENGKDMINETNKQRRKTTSGSNGEKQENFENQARKYRGRDGKQNNNTNRIRNIKRNRNARNRRNDISKNFKVKLQSLYILIFLTLHYIMEMIHLKMRSYFS